MKLNDAVWGALLLALALAVLWNVQSFPRIPGQNIGPAAFPGLLAIVLAACAFILIVRGAAQRRRARQASANGCAHPGTWSTSCSPSGVLVFYIVAANTLGFIVTATLILLALFLKLGVKPKVAFPVAIVTVFVIHLIFYKMLRVSLPWGVLPILY